MLSKLTLLALALAAVAAKQKCPTILSQTGTSKLVCYYAGAKHVDDVDVCGCTHLVYTGTDRGDALKTIVTKLAERRPKMKIVVRMENKNEEIVELVRSSTIHGVELHEAHAVLNRTKITTSTESIRSAIGSDAVLVLSLPANSELLAKYYDLKGLTKSVTLFSLETDHLGEMENETFHPSRLSGVWDMMNTDSVVDLAIGLGVPSSKIVINSPTRAYKFILKNVTLSTPGSPTKETKPTYLNKKELCAELNNGDKWTLERDEDLSAPYAFKDDMWIAFEDTSSLDVKGKYTRIRSLAGMGIVSIDDDSETDCGPSMLQSIIKALGSQSRAPRGALLSSLENEILSVPHSNRLVDAVQLSPYRITRIVDSDGVIHAIREDTRTEFECQRQGYFVHPRTCNRFYRCVKFDQLSDEFTVFEFDCPSGLAFDSRWEVCVWPGSLSHGQACPGSSEIAPVPNSRFVCPEKPGYYADPANCRWFFACLDHGKAPFSAYEFRCPFGLGFDESKLLCDWPWLVPGCGNVGKYEASAYGHGSSVLIGGSSYTGSSADSINIAGHNSLISGASATNHVGIQSGYGANQNAINIGGYDSNIHYENEHYNNAYEAANLQGGNVHLVQNARLVHEGAVLQSGNDASNLHGNSGTILHTANVASNIHGNYGTALHTGSVASDLHGNSGTASYTGNAASNLHDSSGTILHIGSEASNLQGNAGVVLSYENIPNNNLKYELNKVSGAQLHQYNNEHTKGDSAYKSVTGSSAFYNNVNNLEDNTGAYYHDNSGEYKHDYSGEYKHDNGGDYQDVYAPYTYGVSGSGSYNKLNLDLNSKDYSSLSNNNYASNGYKYAGNYASSNQGSYAKGSYNDYNDYNVGETYKKHYDSIKNVNTVYVENVPSVEYSGLKSFSSGYNTASGNAHTLTAGAINAGLVGKATLFDTGSYYKGNENSAYTGSTASTLNYPVSSKTNIVHNHGFAGYQENNDYKNKYDYTKTGTNSNTYSYSTVSPVTVTSAEKHAQPVYVTSPPQVYTYTSTIAPPQSSIKEILGITKPEVSYIQPFVQVTSTPRPIEIEHQPFVSITSYNKPAETYQSYNSYYNKGNVQSAATLGQTAFVHQGYVSSTPKVPIVTYEKAPITKYVNPLIAVSNVTPAPTVAAVSTYVQQPTYSTYVHKPTVSTFVTPSVATYKNQQNTVVHSTHHTQPDYQQSVLLQPLQHNYAETYKSQSNAEQAYNSQYSYSGAYSKPGASQTYQQVSHIQEYVQPVVSSTPLPVVNVQTNTYAPKVQFESSSNVYKGPEYLPPKVEPFVSVSHSVPIKPVIQQTYVTPKPVYNYETVKPIVPSTPYTYVKPIETYKYTQSIPQTVQYVQPSSTPAVVTFEKAFNYKLPSTQTTYINQYTSNYDAPKIQLSTPAPFVYQNPKTVVESFKISSNGHDASSFVSQQNSFASHKQEELYSYQNGQNYEGVHSSTYAPSTYKPVPVKYESTYTYQPVISSTYSPPSTYKPAPVKYESTYTYQPVVTSTYSPPVSYKPVQTQNYVPVNYEATYSSTYLPPIIKEEKYVPVYTSTPAPKVTSTYKAPTYLPPTKKPEINLEYNTYSTTAKPVQYKETYNYAQNTAEEYDYNIGSTYSTTPKPVEYKETFNYAQNTAEDYDYNIGQKAEVVYKKPLQIVEYPTETPSNLLGFSTVGPDAGLVAPAVYVSTQNPIPVTQNYIKAPVVVQKVVEVTPPVVQKQKQKYTVVTKVNDFNPLLVRKLGAVCSCRSNVLRLRKPKPDYNSGAEYDVEYENDYYSPEDEFNQQSLGAPVKSTTPIYIEKKPTLQPIIVPDEPQYYDEGIEIKSTFKPIVVSEEINYPTLKPKVIESNVKIISTDGSVSVRPVRVKAKVRPVTPAPTLATVLVPNDEDVRAFDRYGPGGWRSIDETLQGTIDCQRVGLFRHPKHCNKFYSCRWDCTKKRFTLHVFNCPVQLSFDPAMGACNWPSQGPACESNTLLPSVH